MRGALPSHCSYFGPHLGTLVPMGTKNSFLVPICFQSPHFLQNASKVSAATIQGGLLLGDLVSLQVHHQVGLLVHHHQLQHCWARLSVKIKDFLQRTG